MNVWARTAAVAAIALATGACITPHRYMGISIRTPVTPEEQGRLDAALASGPAGSCVWKPEGGKPVDVPCESLPLPRLAQLAAMDHKPALLELGIRFEEGSRGAPKNWNKAELAYRLAAWQNSYIAGQQVAGVGSASGRSFDPIMVPGTPGLENAEVRLAQLRAKKKAR